MTSASHHLAICCSSIGLAGAEAAGHRGGAAAGDRVEQVEHPLAGQQRGPRVEPLGDRPRAGAPASDETRGRPTPPTRATGSVPDTGPAARTAATVPQPPGGTSTRCGSGPAPSTVPSSRTLVEVGAGTPGSSPTSARSAGRAAGPAARCLPARPASHRAQPGPAVASGRSSPSNTPPSRPGPEPRRTAARPSRRAGAPGARPPVYSYAWAGATAVQGDDLPEQPQRTELDQLGHRGAGQALDVDQRPVDADDVPGHGTHSFSTSGPERLQLGLGQ